MAMKICFVADAASIHTQRWVNYFAERGDEIHLISSRGGEGYDNNVRFYPLPGARSSSLSNYLVVLHQLVQARRLVRMIQPDIVHAHYIAINGYLGVGSGFHPLVLTPWGSDILIHPRKNPLWRTFTRYALSKADLITCDADHILEAATRLGACPGKIHLVYFGTDVQRFSPRRRDEELREQLTLGGSPTVISVRSLDPIYDVESLITAIPLILSEVPATKFLIAGRGSEEARLRNLARLLGVLESVRFVGWIPNGELPRYFAAADVYVSTSLSDAGLSASTAEAMACGLPVVVTDFGDNGKWVQDGVNGFVIPLRNPGFLASKIVCLLRNEDYRRKLGKAGRTVIEERNNYYKEMERMSKIYVELIRECGK